MNKDLDLILHDLNLTNSEIKVYKFLLEFGKNHVGEISKKTQIHRRNVYDSLDRLIQKGFVKYIEENKIKVYSITNPSVILKNIEDKKNKFENILPEILNKYNLVQSKSETMFFSGKEGIKQIFEDQLNEGKEILIFGSTINIKETLKYYFENYDLKRKEKKIRVKIIFDSKVKINDKELKSKFDKIPLSKIKYLDNFNSTNVSEYVYGDNYAIIVWFEENPIAILIKQKEIAEFNREKFEKLWKL